MKLGPAGSPLHREKRENGQKNSLSAKTQGIWKFCQMTGNFVCPSCKFPDSKDSGYCDIFHKIFRLFEVTLTYEIVANF